VDTAAKANAPAATRVFNMGRSSREGASVKPAPMRAASIERRF
jgi:hypothetical protein